jgi:hypothetical protein
MAKLVKVYTSLGHRANRTIKTYVDSNPVLLSFDKDCITEVSEDIVVLLLGNDPSFSIFDKEFEKSLKKKVEEESKVDISLKERIIFLEKENEDLKKEIEALKGKVEVDDNKISKGDLEKMNVAELKAVAEESKLPKEAWEKLNKKDLIDYLFSELNKEE